MRKLIFGKKYVQPLSFIFDLGLNTTTNGTVTRATDHKGGNTAIQFGSGNLVSIDNLPASPVWSISFWIKNTTSQIGQLAELGANPDSTANSFTFGNWGANNFRILETINQNHKSAPSSVKTSIYDNSWHHIVLILDKTKTADNEIKVYLDKVQLALFIVNGQNYNTTGNFISNKIYLGGRGNSFAYNFKGATSPFKLFNYALTQTEIDNLYNE